MSEGDEKIVKVELVKPIPEHKNKAGKIIAGIVGLLTIVTLVISIVQYVSGEEYLLGLFRVKPVATHAYKVGETVHFGLWDWRVLDMRDGKALLITKDIIELQPYHNEWVDVTWEACTLRTYLNGEFLEKFSTQEQEKICEIENVNWDNQWFGISGGSNTKDKVFLLSIEEAVKYFGDSGQFKNKKPDNAFSINDEYNGARTVKFNNEEYTWWLRSPGFSQDRAADITGGGNIHLGGFAVYHVDSIGVRPALWLKLT